MDLAVRQIRSFQPLMEHCCKQKAIYNINKNKKNNDLSQMIRSNVFLSPILPMVCFQSFHKSRYNNDQSIFWYIF